MNKLAFAFLCHLVAARIHSFTNCLSSSAISQRFTPRQLDVEYNSTTYELAILLKGDMQGSVNATGLVNGAEEKLESALINRITVAGYTQSLQVQALCSSTRDPLNTTNPIPCPFGPGPVALGLTLFLNSSYQFATITDTIRINGPTTTDFEVACVGFSMTPPLSAQIKKLLTYVPLSILLLVALKVITVAFFNPWSGTLDPYRAFSNYGMNVNALRLSTPGFSECLAYIQFVAYTAVIRLNYPGFYQPALSRIAWSLLLFDKSPVTSNFDFTPSLEAPDIATYINLVGARRQDAWRSFMVWFLILEACVVALIGVILLAYYVLTPSSTDLTRKNIPFLGGCMLRAYLYFFIPLSIFTSYQLLTASSGLAVVVALACVAFMLLVIGLPVGLSVYLVRYKPRAELYDNLSLLSYFGPLYNTYLEGSMLLFVPSFALGISKGMVIGLLQISGLTQLVLLIVFEFIALLLILIKRPWPARTNTSELNVGIGVIKLILLFLMTAFIPEVGVPTGPREWLGYTILVIHAFVLVLAFLGNALLSLLELAIRLLVIVPQDAGAKAVFGIRQLRTRRLSRQQEDRAGTSNSFANLINETADPSGTQSRAGTQGSNSRSTTPFFRRPRGGSRHLSYGEESVFGLNGLSPTSTPMGVGVQRPLSGASEELLAYNSYGSKARPAASTSTMDLYNLSPQPSVRLGMQRDLSDHTMQPIMSGTGRTVLDAPEDAALRGVDYAVREADIYHPQSSGELLGARKKLGTGPADPTGLKLRKFRWKPWKKVNEERGKFVVIRSSPAAAPRPAVPAARTSITNPDEGRIHNNTPMTSMMEEVRQPPVLASQMDRDDKRANYDDHLYPSLSALHKEPVYAQIHPNMPDTPMRNSATARRLQTGIQEQHNSGSTTSPTNLLLKRESNLDSDEEDEEEASEYPTPHEPRVIRATDGGAPYPMSPTSPITAHHPFLSQVSNPSPPQIYDVSDHSYVPYSQQLTRPVPGALDDADDDDRQTSPKAVRSNLVSSSVRHSGVPVARSAVFVDP